MRYEPYNSNYCKEIKCPKRHGIKCMVKKCLFPKHIRWWTNQEK